MLRRLSLGLVSLLACTSCVLLGQNDAKALAQDLAEAMSAHSLADIPLTRDSDRDRYAQLVAPLDDETVNVTVAEVDVRDADAEVTLHWDWSFPRKAWRYTSTVQLVDDGNRWEVDWAPSALEPSLQDGDRLGLFTLDGARGRFLGQGGVPLVTERPVLRYGLDKTKVKPRQVVASAQRIAEALDIDVAAYVSKVRAAGPEAFVEALVVRVEDARESIDPHYAEIQGAAALEDEMPLAPTRDFAAELFGRVGPATAEIIEESGGEIEAGDVVGTSGLQARYEDQLAGESGIEVVAVGADGQRRRLFRVAADRGRDLSTTIDPDLQIRAEEALATLGEEGPRSALVAVRPSDGRILAVANGPGNGGLDVATAGQYAPGSTFKIVTALALLRAGVEPDDVLSCTDTVEVDGRWFENYDDYPVSEIGDITFTSAIAHSCNTALIAARDQLESKDLAQAAAALGLGVDHDLGFPAYFGQVPAASGETEHAASLIGQGKVLASPMVMAAVAASVEAGRTVVPTLLPDHSVNPHKAEVPLTDAESETLRGLMRAVVTEGSGTFLADIPGEVGAKTGTAEYGTPGPDGSLATHAWMIATHGDLAVAVFVETGQSGSGTAGPILEAFLQ